MVNSESGNIVNGRPKTNRMPKGELAGATTHTECES